METSFHSAELNDLGLQLQTLLGECSLRVQCAIRDERLIVLGQHPEDSALDAQQILRQLERKIQSLQINFTRQVRLYLRRGGHRQPYAHRWFMIQPPPPPRRLPLPLSPALLEEQTARTASVEGYPDEVLQPPDGGAIAVAVRSPDSSLAEPDPAQQTVSQAPPTAHQTDAAEPGLSWFNSSTSILDLDHPVLDAEMFRAIGLDDRDLAFSSHHAKTEPAIADQAIEEAPEPPQSELAALELEAPASAAEPEALESEIPESAVLEPEAPEFAAFISEVDREVVHEAALSIPSFVAPDAPVTAPDTTIPDTTIPDTEEAVWVVGDAELDDLVNQLTASLPRIRTEAIAPLDKVSELISESDSELLSDGVLDGSGLAGNEPSEESVLGSSDELPVALELHFDDRSTHPDHALHSAPDNWASGNLLKSPKDQTDPHVLPVLELDATPESCALFELNAALEADSLEGSESSEIESDDYEILYASEAHELASALEDDSHDYETLYGAELGGFAFVSDDDFNQDEVLYRPESSELATPLPQLDSSMRSLSQQTSERIRQWSQIITHPVRSHVDSISHSPLAQIDGRKAIAFGVTALGMTGAVYTLTRPCVIGACPQIGTAQELGEKSSAMMQQAESWKDLERAGTYLNQAVETLEPIPMWSGYASEAQSLLTAYGAELLMVETLLDVEAVANTASRTSQSPLYSLADWERVRSLWQQAISQLADIPSDSDLYAFAREQLRTYRQRMAWVDQQISLEENAKEALNKSKQAAQLAEARQGSAQSLENWQFARVTWIVALDRLQLVPENTLAFLETEPLTRSYQTSLDAVTRRVEREQKAQQLLTQAKQQAEMAQAAERRLDWQQAVSDWTEAIATVKDIEDGTSPHPQAEDLQATYNQSLSNANEKLLITERIQMELEKTCIGEIRICDLLSVGDVVKVRLDDGYVRAIEAARSSGNNSIQAVVTDHQLILRRALEFIASEYDLPVEVYNPENNLLERHSPRE